MCLFPDEYRASAYEPDYEGFYARGRRAVIFDIDNTLVPHGFPADERAIRLFERLKGIGYECCLLSNNQRERVEMFNRDVQVHFIENAHKPLPGGYRRAMELMGSTVDTTLYVGDQIFTDVMGAGYCGIYTILVEPIDPHEEIQIVLKRYLEKPILWAYRLREKLRARKRKR